MRARAITAAVVAAAVLGYGTLDALDLAPGVLTTEPGVPDPAPYPHVDDVAAPVAVGDLDVTAPLPTEAALADLATALAEDDRLTGQAAVVVADVETGEVLLSVDGDEPRTTASSIKVLTAAAALDALGPARTLTTRALYDGAGTVVLEAGGDVMLAPDDGDPDAVDGRAGLGDLAQQAAAALAADGIDAVDLRLDDTLFTGPALGERWSGADLDFVMPIQPLAVHTGRVGGEYVADPALRATETFAQRLEEAGVTVLSTGRAGAPAEATEIGAVESAPVVGLVRHMLKLSDNTVAEVLARLVAVEQDRPADFAGATAAVRAQLVDLGFDVTGLEMLDASGLSITDRAPAALLTEVVRAGVRGEPDTLAALGTSMPVAGLDGTLAGRMTQAPAAGLVRAKTGTLVESVSLTGSVVTADGRPLAFSVLTTGLEPGTAGQARRAIDDLGSALAACGCR